VDVRTHPIGTVLRAAGKDVITADAAATMKILYAAIDQTVPGTVGGSVHVTAVAAGLAELGHEVHVLAGPGRGMFPTLPGVRWTAMSPPFGAPLLRWMRRSEIAWLARTWQPDAIIERYYNFGGEGIAAGRATGAVTVLEVNAPVVDYRGSTKALVDKALVIQPMRRWRESICNAADLIVAPSHAMLPPETLPEKIVRLEWGADTVRFHPGATGDVPVPRSTGIVAVFAGAFRSWHGAIHLARAIRELRQRGDERTAAVFVGDGPELPAVRAEAAGLEGVYFTGAIDHVRMPGVLAAADVGVAPFDVAAHPPLSLGFYWSPLKIFEYMASGLPVVAPAVDRIPDLVAHEREGILYDPSSAGALATALERLSDKALRQRLSAAARERAVRDYSWAAHCKTLAEAIRSKKQQLGS
jgi:glycosyltransferase involved in cell wall biosynthesis